MKKKKRRNRFAYVVFITFLVFTISSLSVPVYASVYDDSYNIHDAIAYAEKWKESINDVYGYIDPDCTNFVSQCLVAGGIEETDGWNSNSTWSFPGGYSDGYTAFVNVGLLASYLSQKGYSISETIYGDSNELKKLHISAGDIIQFDHEGDGVWDHSMICVGLDKDGQIMVAGHSFSYYGPFNETSVKPIFNGLICTEKCFRVIYMTDTSGLTDVSRTYVGKRIAIKSTEVDQYVSPNTNQDIAGINTTVNKTTASALEYFDVIAGDYGEVGFKACSNGNYLSARIDENDKSPYIQAAYGQHYTKPQSWESFRIFEKDGIQYIQSQANGKWVQAAKNETDNPLKAAGASASTWERFQIEVVNTALNNTSSDLHIGGKDAAMALGGPTTVSQYYHGSDYNEGWYEGEWQNGTPNGYGKLTYDDFEDGKYYSSYGYKAVSYEGYFADGYRSGRGKVIYENGWWEEGEYYGMWQRGKTVFDGRLYIAPNCYCTVKTTATNAVEAHMEFGEWVTS